MEYQKQKHDLGFFQASPLPTEEELAHFYSEQYFQSTASNHGVYKKDYSQEEIAFFKNQALVAEFIWKRFTLKDSGRLLDVGCGEGFFLDFFQKRGWHIEGCDFASDGLEHHNRDLLKYFVQGDIFTITKDKAWRNERYDSLNLGNVLEHVTDPIQLLLNLKNLLHEKSLLRIVIPNDFTKFQELLLEKGMLSKETWFNPPVHLNYFSVESLKNVFQKTGLRVVDILVDFPIELYLVNLHSNYWADRTKGSDAHKARMLIDTFLVNQGLENYVHYMSAAAACSFGRNIIAYVSLG